MVWNTHERIIEAPLAKVGALIDRLASRDDQLWPKDRWPALRLDRPLSTGARGGHGPIRYFVEAYEAGRSIRFRFTAPRGFHGTHGLEAEEVAPGVVRLRHTLCMRVDGWARLSWPLFFRWLHDALIEDALDGAESHVANSPTEFRQWSLWVRLLRHLAAYFSKSSRQRAARAERAREETQRDLIFKG
jgi:hypothetical protein